MLAFRAMLVSDGAYATLLAPHVPHGVSVDALLDRAPERVVDAHCAYIDAGARRIHSPTLMCCTQTAKTRRVRYRIALELMEAAVDASDVHAASDIAAVVVMGPASTQARDYWNDIELVLDLGATNIACLTIPDARHALAFAQAWHDVAVRGGAEAQCTLSCGRWDTPDQGINQDTAGRINLGWATMCSQLQSLGLGEQLEMGLNCGWGSEGLVEAVAEVARAWGRPIRIAPSTGIPASADMSEWANTIVGCMETGDVSSVGGCCGTTPAWIAALVAART